jgi:hypothetical protein
MHLFTLKGAAITKGIHLQKANNYAFIAIGDNGRGEKLFKLPVSKELFDASPNKIATVASLRRSDEGLVLCTVADLEDSRALVLVESSNQWDNISATFTEEIKCPLIGKKAYLPCECGWHFTDGSRGWIKKHRDDNSATVKRFAAISKQKGIKVLASGSDRPLLRKNAMDEHLLLMEPESCFRLYKGVKPKEAVSKEIFWSNGMLRVTDFGVAKAAYGFEEESGEVI